MADGSEELNVELGQVIGRVRSVVKDPHLASLTLVVLQALDENLQPIGAPLVAADPYGAVDNQYVYWEKSLEARFAVADHMAPLDAAVVGLLNHLGSKPDACAPAPGDGASDSSKPASS